MRQKILYSVFIVVIGLSIIGITANVIFNPKQLLTSILIMFGVAFIILIGFNLILTRSKGRNTQESKKYRAAVKQSQRRSQTNQPIKKSKLNKRKQKRQTHLTVIQGKKSQKK